ncbi:MAG: hypothetical protein JWM05_1649, partial [Acidimicrobiales bacterium]|nr:hypothetical protein [Acidimicrobiales bacterium]
MAMGMARWVKYAKARLNATVRDGNDELDRLEAAQDAEQADRPWLAASDGAPTLDEAKARIEWEAERQHRSTPTAPPRSAAPGATPAA